MNIDAGALTFAMKFDLAGSGTWPVRIRVLKMPGRRRLSLWQRPSRSPGTCLWSVRKMLWRVLPPRRDPLPGWV